MKLSRGANFSLTSTLAPSASITLASFCFLALVFSKLLCNNALSLLIKIEKGSIAP